MIASVCVAAFPLAKSGVLKGRKAITCRLRKGYKRKELEETGAEAIDRNYTAETLKAVIDSSGRLLTIEYRLSYDYGQEIDGETVKTITQYSNATLERSNDDSIVLPE